MKILIKMCFIVLVVTIPVTSFCLGANLVTRMPDVYQYEFKANDALKHFDLNKNNDEMGEFISDFMIGKESKIQLVVGDEERAQVAFNKNEILATAKARKYMNVVAALGSVTLVLLVGSFIMLKKYEYDREIRKEFRLSVIIYIVMLVLYLVGFYVAAKTGYGLGGVLGYVPEENDLLPQIITEGLTKRLYFSTAGVSTIIMIIMGYAMHKITEPKRIFSRSY